MHAKYVHKCVCVLGGIVFSPLKIHAYIVPTGEGGRPPRGHRRRCRGARGGEGAGGKPQKIIQSPDRLYEAPTDYTKPRQTIQSHKKTIQRHKILDETLKY